MSDISARRAKSADIERIAAFQQAMALETEGKTLDPETLRQGVVAVFQDARKGFYIVAVASGAISGGAAADAQTGDAQVVGSMLITYEWSDWRNATFWWIQSVYVHAAWRRIGVYRRMYAYALAAASARKDVCGIRLYVERANAVAQQTYANLGMRKSHYDLYEIDLAP